MRQLYILICILTFTSVTAFGQFWNKPDAQYTFYWSEFVSGYYVGFKQLTLNSDTLIDGKLFTRYHDYSVSYMGGTNNFDSAYFDTTSAISQIAFYEEDSILYGHHLNFYFQGVDTLYNFKALPGESWTLPQGFYNEEGLDYFCDSAIKVTVLDTGHTLLQNISLYYLVVEYGGFRVTPDSGFIPTTDTIFERFGSKNYSFLSVFDYCTLRAPNVDGGTIYNLRCYYDNEILLGQGCTYLYVPTSINELDKDKLTIYPNPANTFVRIQTFSKQIYLTDFVGKVLLTVSVKNDTADIDVSGLTDGVYFLTTSDGYTNKLIVRH